MDDTQRYTGAYNTQVSLEERGKQDAAGRPLPDRQDTTFISPATGVTRTFLPGDVIDSTYLLLKLLGRGGMGIVFACRHKILDKEYALKLLPDEQLRPEGWSRFQAEAKVLARLNNPRIVGIHNMGIESGRYPYYVMDLIDGETLDVIVEREGPLTVEQSLDVYKQVCDALSAAHLQGIIHRDIKPSNLMLTGNWRDNNGAVKLTDFGIARLTKHDASEQSQTATGLVFGTPYYMSPEQCLGQRADHRSDIYSLGCALFETLTGRPPFVGENAFRTFFMHQTETPPRLASIRPQGKFPEALELMIAKMLSKNPGERYQTMIEVRHDLERIKAGNTINAQSSVVVDFPARQEEHLPADKNTSQWATDTPQQGKNKGPAEAPLKSKIPLIAFTALLIFCVGGTGLYIFREPVGNFRSAISDAISNTVFTALLIPKDSDMRDAGYTVAEIEQQHKLFGINIMERLRTVRAELKKFVDESKRDKQSFRSKNGPQGFNFPEHFSLGAIQVGNAAATLATGFVPAAQKAEVCLYLQSATQDPPDWLKLFGPDDITAVYLNWDAPSNALVRIQDIDGNGNGVRAWKRLKELCFFNPLLKMPPGAETLDESALQDKDLGMIEHFSKLTSLGLSGKKLTAPAITKMKLFHKLETLKLKSIRDVDQVLKALPNMPNLNELWLFNEKTDDAQLALLTHLPKLRVLKIRRSNTTLTPDSVYQFAKMSGLRELSLDNNWTESEKNLFQSRLPDCLVNFEPTADGSFWPLIRPTGGWPKQPPATRPFPGTSATEQAFHK